MRALSKSLVRYAAGFCWLAWSAAGNAAQPPCESAQVLKIRTQVLSEAQGQPAAIYDIFLECAGKLYVARIAGRAQAFDPDGVGTKVRLRTSPEGKTLARGEDGTEFEVTLAPISKP